MSIFYDKVIIGAGIYGLYFAVLCGERGEKVAIMERDPEPFMRATYVNQARVHKGYHYPRSIATAKKSCKYFDRFLEDYGFCIHRNFDQIYATSTKFSWTNKWEFQRFCKSINARCDEVSPDRYFKSGMCDGAFLTEEYTYDAQILKKYFVEKINNMQNVDMYCSCVVQKITSNRDVWSIKSNVLSVETPFILNATYAAVNDLHRMAGLEPFRIKYEKCEIILCKPEEKLQNIGITVMDGPFFTIMPFGNTGLHSLTSVSFTPHETSYLECAEFDCQGKNDCRAGNLCNCNDCEFMSRSSWEYMKKLAMKYLREEYGFTYVKRLYSIKPILVASELDDSRPTVIRKMCDAPTFVSVLSGKINTVYDLEEVL